MRILMAVPKYPFPAIGGLERQAHELAKALIQRGHSVRVVSSRFDSRQHDVEFIEGVQVYRVPWNESRLVRFMFLPFRLARILLQVGARVELIHVHNISWFGAFITLLARALGKPVITKLSGVGDFGIPAIRRRPLGLLRIGLLKMSDSIVAMTPESVSELASIHYPLAQVLKVTNGIPLSREPSSPPGSGRSETVNAVFVGRLSPEKGLVDLWSAWANVKARTTRPVKLRVIGTGPQEGELRTLTVALDLGDTVEFTGYCEDVQAELSKADLFVLPSYSEGNSNAILEAMRAGLPVIATRVGGTPIQVGNHGQHFLVKPGDREALADRLLELIEDDVVRRNVGALMNARITELFSIEQVAAIYEKAYELILAGRQQDIGHLNQALFNQTRAE
jgi:glycosyltransferase involved in cell wall biosynthesis